jgi:hypothetical protein
MVEVKLLSIYDLTFIMEDPVTSVGEATISWHLEDEDGGRIDDKALIDALAVKLRANDGSGVREMDFPQGQTTETFKLAPGDYDAYLTMNSGGADKESNSKKFTVPSDPPVALWAPGADTLQVSLITIFKPRDTVYLDSLVKYTRANEPLDVNWKKGNWENFVEMDYDSFDAITVAALKSGDASAEISVEGVDGSSVTIFLDVKIASGIVYIAIAAAVLLILAAGIVLFLRKRKPHLDDPMRSIPIEVKNLPDGIDYPQAGDLRLEHTKAKRTLQQIIEFNREYRNEYSSALFNVGWFLAGTELMARGKTQLDISIPASNRFTVQVDGQNLQGPYRGYLRNDRNYRELRINIIQDNDNVYEIILGKRGGGNNDDINFDFNDKSGGGGIPYQGSGIPDSDFDLI